MFRRMMLAALFAGLAGCASHHSVKSGIDTHANSAVIQVANNGPTCGPTGQSCAGRYGSGCYFPSRGETCTDGKICGPSSRACVGRYGSGCATTLETCTEGKICGPSTKFCLRNGRATCYDPLRDRCNT